MILIILITHDNFGVWKIKNGDSSILTFSDILNDYIYFLSKKEHSRET